MPAEIKPSTSGKGLRVGVVRSRFNEEVTSKLLDGALAALAESEVRDGDIVVADVPGAWEIPFALQQMARRGKFDALVAVGAVIRGETAHFDYVAGGFNDGALAVMLETGIPVGNGVLTTEDDAQAEARAGGAHGNKGADAALAALEMANFTRALAKRKKRK